MQFDTFVVARLLEGPNPPVLAEDGENELQDAHLAHIADLWASGDLIAAGPASGPDGLHGVSIFVMRQEAPTPLPGHPVRPQSGEPTG